MTTLLAPSKFPVSLTLLGGSPTGVWPSLPGSKGGPGWLRGSSGEAVTQGRYKVPAPPNVHPSTSPAPAHLRSVLHTVKIFPNLPPGLAWPGLA